jgi:threonine/homoserine/homoserine lactone efflux protein
MLKTMLVALAVAAFALFVDPSLLVAAPVVEVEETSDWIGKLIGVVILAGVLYFGYTRWKKSKEKKAAREASRPAPRPPLNPDGTPRI